MGKSSALRTRILTLCLLLTASSALAGARLADGQWGGADAQGRTVQIIVSAGELMTVYLLDDYYEPTNVHVRGNGTEVDFSVGSAQVTFVRSAKGGTVTVHPPGEKAFVIKVRKD